MKLQLSNSKTRTSISRAQIGRRRRIIAAIVIFMVLVAIAIPVTHAIGAACQKWEDAKQVLVVEDSYGKLHRLHSLSDLHDFAVTGPARVWSEKYAIGIDLFVGDKPQWGHHTQFSGRDTAMKLTTQGGDYTVYLQPPAGRGVDYDLTHNVRSVVIHLN